MPSAGSYFYRMWLQCLHKANIFVTIAVENLEFASTSSDRSQSQTNRQLIRLFSLQLLAAINVKNYLKY